MKIEKEDIQYEFHRGLYWTRIFFTSDDGVKKTKVFTCASMEYLSDFYRIVSGDKLNQDDFDDWLSNIVKKWSILGEEIFNQDVHYDVYANTQEGEANGIDFLVKEVK